MFVIVLGLEKNETAPKPVLSEPRLPSEKEKEEAVQLFITQTRSVSKKLFEKQYKYISLGHEDGEILDTKRS